MPRHPYQVQLPPTRPCTKPGLPVPGATVPAGLQPCYVAVAHDRRPTARRDATIPPRAADPAYATTPQRLVVDAADLGRWRQLGREPRSVLENRLPLSER